MINGDLSQSFNIQKGVRQGCPLSPLLFIIALEILLVTIREDQGIKSLKIRGEQYKLMAFADDIIFTIEEPNLSGVRLLKIIEEYGAVAGLKINRQKTKMLTKNMTKQQIIELEERLGLQAVKKLKYLGIWLTNKTSSIKDDNYTKLLTTFEKDLETWSKLQLSLLGRISCLKMNILPKLMYLYQVIPINPGKNFFQKLNKITMKFIWQGKRARIKKTALQDVKERGGLAAPNWETYYEAATLSWMGEWIRLDSKRVLYLEGYGLLRGWHWYLWEGLGKQNIDFSRHLIRASLIKTWQKIKKIHYPEVPRWWSPLEALVHPNVIEVGKTTTYQQLLDRENNIMSRQELQAQNITVEWWPYNQLTSRCASDKKKSGIARKASNLDKILLGPDRGKISKIYNYLLKYNLHEETVKETMIRWAKDLGYNIPLIEWERLWSQNIRITKSTSYKENLLKMFYRWHLPPARIAKMYKNVSELCWKCKGKKGTYMHMWWNCRKMQQFWKMINKIIYEITDIQLDYKPEVYLLGVITGVSKGLKYLITHILTAARLVIAKNWKIADIPDKAKIIQKTNECAEMDMLTLKIQDKEESEFYQIWQKWYEWLDKGK